MNNPSSLPWVHSLWMPPVCLLFIYSIRTLCYKSLHLTSTVRCKTSLIWRSVAGAGAGSPTSYKTPFLIMSLTVNMRIFRFFKFLDLCKTGRKRIYHKPKIVYSTRMRKYLWHKMLSETFLRESMYLQSELSIKIHFGELHILKLTPCQV